MLNSICQQIKKLSSSHRTGKFQFSVQSQRKVKSESEVPQSCPTLFDPMDCSPPGSSIHGIFQARVLEWVAISFSKNCYKQWINIASGSCAFSKPSLYIWKSSVHILLKPSLKDFEHNLVSMWNKHNCMVAWTFFSTALCGDWNENWPLPVLCHCWAFQICWHIECSSLTASPFRIWNSSAGIPSLP